MAAGIFLLLALTMLLAFLGKRWLSIGLAGITMVLAILLLLHHMTETIPVRL